MEGQAERLLQARAAPLLPSWSATPLPSLSLSAGALLALADLGTVARRTALTGGASWLDALVLAPGLHYQQAADAVQGGGSLLMMETTADDGDTVAAVRNAATVAYLERLPHGDDDDEDTLTVVQVSLASTGGALAMLRGTRRRAQQRPPPPEIDWLSDLLYALSPLLTLAALTLMVLLGDWWGLSFLLALMLARLLNIITIRHRSRSPPPLASASLLPTTSHVVVITGSPRRRVILRGRADDLQAVTARAWLRPRAPADGYREAAGKLLVYGVAACGGNMTQAGVLVLAGLLLVSAGLLGLSNACFKGWCVHGRVARPVSRGKQDEEEDLEQGGPQLTPVEHGRGR